MSDIDRADVIHTRIWHEEPEPGNPFATRAAYCRGYDVFGQMVGNARWVEMLVLLFHDDLPGKQELDMLEALAVAFANPGTRDPSVHAAMCGGVGGSTAAASLMAALAVGAGRNNGAREVFDAMENWARCGDDLNGWTPGDDAASPHSIEVWPDREHPAGFDPHGSTAPTVVRQLLGALVRIGATPRLRWLAEHREELEKRVGLSLAFTGIAAAAFADLGFAPHEGEILYLLLRLPGAAAHALEQGQHGYRRFPFYPVELEGVSERKDLA